MAKKKARSSEPDYETTADRMAALRRKASRLLRHTCEAMRQEYNDPSIAVAGEAGCMVIGIPLPSLAVEYILQNTVFPLGRMTQIVGTEGTCKSALCFEIARWFNDYAGTAYLLENESKYSADYANSIMGWPTDAESDVLGHLRCNSLEDWQSRLQDIVRRIKEAEEGSLYPVLLILDSIMGKLAAESQDNIERVGYADRQFPVEALKINNFLKKFPQDIEGWPMCFVAVNHLKPQKSDSGPHMERNKAGGRSISFQETFEIEMKRDVNPNIRLVDDANFEIGGLNLTLACKKNSLGETERKIRAAVKWTHRPIGPDGEYLQVTRWDWPEATVKLLTSFEKGHRANKIKEIVNIQGSGQKFWCTELGATKNDPLSAHDLGVLIESDAGRKTELRKLFGIKERRVFEPGRPFAAQVEDERVRVKDRIAKLERAVVPADRDSIIASPDILDEGEPE